MKKYAWIAVIALGVSFMGPQTAFAEEKTGGDEGGDKGGFAAVDADGSGEVSLEELKAVRPKVKEAGFTKLDKDGSGGLNEEEYSVIGKKKGGKKKAEASDDE